MKMTAQLTEVCPVLLANHNTAAARGSQTCWPRFRAVPPRSSRASANLCDCPFARGAPEGQYRHRLPDLDADEVGTDLGRLGEAATAARDVLERPRLVHQVSVGPIDWRETF